MKKIKHWDVWDWFLRPLMFICVIGGFFYLTAEDAQSNPRCMTVDRTVDDLINRGYQDAKFAHFGKERTKELLEFSKTKVPNPPYNQQGIEETVLMRTTDGKYIVFFIGGLDGCEDHRVFGGPPEEFGKYIESFNPQWFTIGEQANAE